MLDNLTQETINQYATDAQSIDEPLGTDWTQGVAVGRTIPAKWWNWLFSAVTTRINQAKTDTNNILTELKNTVTGAGITIDPADSTQLSQAVHAESQNGVVEYVNDKKGYFSRWVTDVAEGLRAFNDSDTITVERLEAFPGSNNTAFYLRLKQHTSDPVGDYWWHFTSTDLLHWYEITAPNGAELQTAEIRYYKGYYYFLYSVKNTYNAQLYRSSDAAAWTSVRSFSEYGTLALRVANDVLWIISAAYQTYSDVSYHSFRSTDGTNWTDAGAIFRNPSTVVDKIGEAVAFGSRTIIGNKVTTDGLSWSTIVTDWVNCAYSKILFGSDGQVVMQFNAAEGALYTIAVPTGTPVKRTGNWEIMLGDAEGNIMARNTTDNSAGHTTDGVTFNSLGFEYPSAADTAFFKLENTYVFGKKKSGDLSTWTDITMPTGETASPQAAGIGYYIIAGTHFTNDFGENWGQGEAAGVPFCAVPLTIDSVGTCTAFRMSDGTGIRCMTFNGVNRVIGTTLYLR